jgi:hypothetical protein
MGSAASRGSAAGTADHEAQRSAPLPPPQQQQQQQQQELQLQLQPQPPQQRQQQQQLQQQQEQQVQHQQQQPPQYRPSPLNEFLSNLFQTHAADGSKFAMRPQQQQQQPQQFDLPGVLHRWGSDDPVSTAMSRAVAFGLVGAGFGGVLSTIKDASAVFFMTSMGANYLMIGLLYFGTLEIAKRELPQLQDWHRHAAVGATTGAILGSLGPTKRRLSFAAIFAAGGVGGYFMHRGFLGLRAARAEAVLEGYRREEQARLERDGT